MTLFKPLFYLASCLVYFFYPRKQIFSIVQNLIFLHSSRMMEPELLTEVPASLKRLAKQVVRGFYGIEHALALDVLIRNPCVREEDMLELLKFDRKQLRSVLNTLKADKFVKCRMRVETAPDGKTTRHNYYFINYRFYEFFIKILNWI